MHVLYVYVFGVICVYNNMHTHSSTKQFEMVFQRAIVHFHVSSKEYKSIAWMDRLFFLHVSSLRIQAGGSDLLQLGTHPSHGLKGGTDVFVG